jgi:2-amino-4-hydroxy-6-hydroxymethyldihydropteridine diphosphokinase
VLVPLAELAPALEIPGLGRIADRAQEAGTEGLSLWDALDAPLA